MSLRRTSAELETTQVSQSTLGAASEAYWLGHAIEKGKTYPPDVIRQTVTALRREGLRTLAARALKACWKRVEFDADVRSEFARMLASCILDDPTVPQRSHLDRDSLGRLDRARAILKEARGLLTRADPDLCYAAGHLEYLSWEQDGRRESLERALALFCDAASVYHQQAQRADALSRAAVLLDLLAFLESHAAGSDSPPETAVSRRARAHQYREEIVRSLREVEIERASCRECLTIAATLFGLDRRDQACHWLRAALAADPKDDPDFGNLIRQFVMLARIKTGTPTQAEMQTQQPWQTLSSHFGSYAVLSWLTGKVGLALSGGGFRASLYHLGVLAKLADLDLLRFVEVLSCVSGGSIVGAYYYLELRQLFHRHPDRDLTQREYQELIARLIKNFLHGVQKNIRVRALVSWPTNLRLLFRTRASRSEQIACLLDEIFYSRSASQGKTDVRTMRSLRIEPIDGVLENWRRSAKLPELVINATALDTGLGWQITPEWMGDLAPDVPGDDRYTSFIGETPYLGSDAVDFSLGHAVAASAAVPGLFEPIVAPFTSIHDVKLTDGGVYDNQGISALLDRGCRVTWTSDASGQLHVDLLAGGGLVGSALRASDIQAKRLRGFQFSETAFRESPFVRNVAVHLRKGVQLKERGVPENSSDETIYGFPREIESLLSSIRTDLDSFCDIEAYSLMALGYRMLEKEISEDGFDAREKSNDRHPWSFLEIEPILKGPRWSPATSEAYAILEAGSGRFLKAWSVVWWLRLLTWLVVGAGAIGAAWWFEASLWHVLLLLVMMVAGVKLATRRGGTDFAGRVIAAVLLVLTFPLSNLLPLFDRIYLNAGSLEKIRNTLARTHRQ